MFPTVPQLRNLLLVPAPRKLLVLAGPCLEETGELLLQTGGFSSHHFLQVLEDREVSFPHPSPSSCPEAAGQVPFLSNVVVSGTGATFQERAQCSWFAGSLGD